VGLLAGCASTKATQGPAGSGKDKTELVIGMTRSTTGDAAHSSEQGVQGIQIWQDEVNAQGGIFVKQYNKKLPIKIVFYDDRSDKQQVTKLYEKLITEDKVDLLIGPFGSTLTTAAAVVTEKYQKPLIIWSAASDALYSQGFRYIISASQIASSELSHPKIDQMKALGYKKLALIYLDESYPASESDNAKKYAEAQGMEVVLYEKFAKGNQDYTSLLAKLADKKPDAVYVSAYEDQQANMVRQMREQNLMFPYVFMTYSSEPNWLQLTGDDGMYIVGGTLADPSVKFEVTDGLTNEQFWDKFAKKFNGVTPSLAASQAYACGVMLEKYAATANTLSATDIKQAALDLSGKVTLVTGNYVLDPSGKQLGMNSVLTQAVKDASGKQKLNIVWPEAVKTGDSTFPIPQWNQRKK